ncbi:MAG TPA: shikimate kinase [Bryobacteraceae bacterium]|nr:shikimate kinase [Bryobacteraceae bacterium]
MILKLKRTPGIYLVGFMGSGKSTVGRLLADRLGWNFIDVDEQIEAEQGVPIFEIFEKSGEQEFRRIEREAIERRVGMVEAGHPMVLALGGGAFVEPHNRDLLKENGITIWLDCPFATVKARVARAAHRPLARDPKRFEDLYHNRRAAYEQADYRIEIDGDDPEQPVRSILALPIF